MPESYRLIDGDRIIALYGLTNYGARRGYGSE